MTQTTSSWSLLKNLPKSRVFLLDTSDKASHDDGLTENREDFHWLLYNFLIALFETHVHDVTNSTSAVD